MVGSHLVYFVKMQNGLISERRLRENLFLYTVCFVWPSAPALSKKENNSRKISSNRHATFSKPILQSLKAMPWVVHLDRNVTMTQLRRCAKIASYSACVISIKLISTGSFGENSFEFPYVIRSVFHPPRHSCTTHAQHECLVPLLDNLFQTFIVTRPV